MKMGKVTDVLLNNYIDKDVEAMMKPLIILQNLVFTKRYTLKDSFVTSISRKDRFISASVMTFLFLIHLYSNIIYILHVLSVLNSGILNFYTMLEIVLFGSGLVANVVVNNRCSELNVTLLLKMQEAHRVTKSFENDTRSITFWNWINVAVILAYSYGFTLYYCFYYNTPTATFLVVLCVNTNVIYGMRIINFLTKKLEVWTKMLKNADMKSKGKCHKMGKAYLDIMEAYHLFQKAYSFLLTFHIVDSFCHILIYLEVFISINNNKALRVFVAASWKVIVIWVIKNMAMQVLVGVGCERFYIAVEEAQVTCAQFLKRKDCPEYAKRTWRKLVQSQWAWSRTTGCGVFKVDGMMPLRLLETIATYTIVLLQFAFL